VLGVDVTDRKKAHDTLLQTEKLAAVGRLASSIAHEINNPLAAITNLIYLAQSTTDDPVTQGFLSSADVELRRVAAITNQTLRFHRQSTGPTTCMAEDLIAGTLQIYRGRLANSQIEVSRRDRALHPILCYDGEIRQVLSNLVGNAIDSMNRGGQLLIRSREGTNWKSDTKGVILTFADTGTGMNRATLAKIFEPFFTTKSSSGTGLGLWVSQDIVKRHRGSIGVRTSQRRSHTGTVFNVFLPFDPAPRS
jgi:signal transduction histidine kinase